MNQKALGVFGKVYPYFQVSLYFWGYLLRGGIIYSLIPTCTALLLTIKEMQQVESELSVKQIFAKYNSRFKNHKLGSFIFSLILVTAYSSLVLLNKGNTATFSVATIVVIYLIVVTILLISYTSFYLGSRQFSFKKSVTTSFVMMIKQITTSISLVIVVTVLFTIAYFNFLLYIIAAPFLYGVSANFLFRKLLPVQ